MNEYWLSKFQGFAKFTKRANPDIKDFIYFEYIGGDKKLLNGLLEINKKAQDIEGAELNQMVTRYDAFIGKHLYTQMTPKKFKTLATTITGVNFEFKLYSSLIVKED